MHYSFVKLYTGPIVQIFGWHCQLNCKGYFSIQSFIFWNVDNFFLKTILGKSSKLQSCAFNNPGLDTKFSLAPSYKIWFLLSPCVSIFTVGWIAEPWTAYLLDYFLKQGPIQELVQVTVFLRTSIKTIFYIIGPIFGACNKKQ